MTSVLTPAPGSQTLSYAYNANGNQVTAMLPGGTAVRNIAWTTYDLPGQVSVTGSAIVRKFRYGPDRGRFVQEATDELGTTRYLDYVGDMYLRTLTGSDEEHKHYLFANGQRVGVLVDTKLGAAAPTKTFRFFHRDHLGSITSITDKPGATFNVERLSYDAFGKRRHGTTWGVDPLTTSTEERGYTGHEHLDDVSLIHMNGRVFDPSLGRMLSPDPIVSSPLSGQSWNRYSYVNNNPLRFTDPSGFAGCDNLDSSCGHPDAYNFGPDSFESQLNELFYRILPPPFGTAYLPGLASAFEATAEVLVNAMLDGVPGAREEFRQWQQMLHAELPWIFGPRIQSDDGDDVDSGNGNNNAGGCPGPDCPKPKKTGRGKRSPASSATAGNVPPGSSESAGATLAGAGFMPAGQFSANGPGAIINLLPQESAGGAPAQITPEIEGRLRNFSEQQGGVRIDVHSGIRTPEQNRQVGGSPDSQHLPGRGAADISIPGLSGRDTAARAYHSGEFGRVNLYPDGRVHVDLKSTSSPMYYEDWRPVAPPQ